MSAGFDFVAYDDALASFSVEDVESQTIQNMDGYMCVVVTHMPTLLTASCDRHPREDANTAEALSVLQEMVIKDYLDNQ